MELNDNNKIVVLILLIQKKLITYCSCFLSNQSFSFIFLIYLPLPLKYENCNSTVLQGRSNDHGVDLNRNFPARFPSHRDISGGVFLEKETLAAIKWFRQYPFVLSANFHGGPFNSKFDIYEDYSCLILVRKSFLMVIFFQQFFGIILEQGEQ